MATTYTFKGMGAAIPYNAPGFNVMQVRLDFADLVANPDKVALASAPTVGLTTWAGLAGASADVFQIFSLPAGTWVHSMGLSVVTADSLTGTVTLGDGDDPNGFGAAKILNAVASQVTLKDDAYGPDNVSGVFYAAADTLDIVSATATIAVAVVDFWAICAKVNEV